MADWLCFWTLRIFIINMDRFKKEVRVTAQEVSEPPSQAKVNRVAFQARPHRYQVTGRTAGGKLISRHPLVRERRLGKTSWM